LSHLERRLQDGAAGEQRASNSVEQFLGDVAREARDVSSRLWRSLAGTRRLALRVAEAVGSPRSDAAGVDERLRDALAEALRPAARGWLGLRLRTEMPLPQRGGVLIAFNRSAWPLPVEAVIASAAVSERARRRDVYVLWDPIVADALVVGIAMRRLGVLPAAPGVARDLLERGALVLCFPEGKAAREKSYVDRYRLTRFADDFMVGEACAARAPIVPGAILGHEESYPVLGRIAGVPVTPTFPFAGMLGLVPLPLGWKVRIDAPVPYEERGAANAADLLRARMQAMLGEMLSERRSIVRG